MEWQAIDEFISGREPGGWTKSVESTRRALQLGAHRARVSPRLLDRIGIDYYGTQTPLKQYGDDQRPRAADADDLPFDPSQIKGIEKVIMESDLGLQPSMTAS